MARIRRRAYPRHSTLTVERPDRKYGAKGNARGKHTRRKTTRGKG